jgi:hypothetical protein
MKKELLREILKFLSGAFFVTAGASWYFAWLKIDLPFLGATMTHQFLAYRGLIHFCLFVLCLYYGFLKKDRN